MLGQRHVFCGSDGPVNTKPLYDICTTLGQRVRRLSDIVQMFCVFTGGLSVVLDVHPLTNSSLPSCGIKMAIHSNSFDGNYATLISLIRPRKRGDTEY